MTCSGMNFTPVLFSDTTNEVYVREFSNLLSGVLEDDWENIGRNAYESLNNKCVYH